jgi:transposase
MDMGSRTSGPRANADDAPAKLVVDRCHLAQHLHDAVDQVRRAEHRTLKQLQDDRLTGHKGPLVHAPQGHDRRATGDLPASPAQ